MRRLGIESRTQAYGLPEGLGPVHVVTWHTEIQKRFLGALAKLTLQGPGAATWPILKTHE
jgi:hypothetical protein